MRYVSATLLLTLIASPLWADGFCGQVTGVLNSRVTDAAELSLPGGAVGACTTSLDLSGARALNCAWAFAFRDGTAQAAFERALTALQACPKAGAGAARDQGVNHPDFYDLRLFQSAAGEVGLSLKDKGALQQTYVFLRIAPAP